MFVQKELKELILNKKVLKITAELFIMTSYPTIYSIYKIYKFLY